MFDDAVIWISYLIESPMYSLIQSIKNIRLKEKKTECKQTKKQLAH